MSNNPIQWSALGSAVTLLQSSATATGWVGALSTGFVYTGEVVDNRSGYQYGDLMVKCTPSAAWAAGDYFSGWLLRSPDNAAWEFSGLTATSTGTTATIPSRAPDFIVPVQVNAVAQTIIIPLIMLPSAYYKVAIQNNTTKATTTTTGANGVWVYPYNDNLVATT